MAANPHVIGMHAPLEAVALVHAQHPAEAAAPGAGAAPAARRGAARLFNVRTFESFAEPGFGWFFVSTLGQMGAAIMQIFVRTFLVYELTGSYLAIGIAAIAGAVPQLLLGPYGGVLADRFPKRTVTQVFQGVGLANTLAMGTLATLGALEYWHLVVTAFFQGVLVAMMVPARQAMVSEIVSKRRIMNGVSLNNAAMNMMQFAGPAAGGLLLATIGAGGTFFVMSGGYVIAMLAMLKIPHVPAQAQGRSGGLREMASDVAGGFRYIARHETLRPVLALSFAVSALGMPFQQLLPGFVQDVFGASAALAGLFVVMSALGAIGASLILASLRRVRRGWILLGASAVLAAALLGISLSQAAWLTLALMLLLGVGQAGRMSLSATIIQEQAEAEYRGRAMSVLMMQFALMQFGAFVLSILADGTGIRPVVAGMSLALVALTLAATATMPGVRRLR